MVLGFLELQTEEMTKFLGNNFVLIIIACVCGYLLGSISFSVIFTKKPLSGTDQDIRNLGSKNAGFTNVLRCVGKKPAIFTFIFDFLKGVAAALVGEFIFSFALGNTTMRGVYFSGFFCILGHIFPCFFEFRGGKAVLTSAAIILFLDYRIFLVIALVFFLTLALTRIVSLSSVLAAIFYPLSTVFIVKGETLVIAFSVIVSSLVIFKHKKNLKKILKNQEKKISIKK